MIPEIPQNNSIFERINSVFKPEEQHLGEVVKQAYLQATIKNYVNYSIPKSERYRAYHNSGHTEYVLNAILDMHQKAPEVEKLGNEELALLLVAASYHDSVFETGQSPKQNELESGELAVAELSHYLDEEQKEIVKLIIESTYTTVSEEGLNRSVEVVEKIGNYRVELMSRLLQDADVSSLGTKGFAQATVGLAQEWGKSDNNNFRAFLEAQSEILTNHSFQTEAGQAVFSQVTQNRDLLQLYLKKSEVTPEGLLKFFERNWSEQV